MTTMDLFRFAADSDTALIERLRARVVLLERELAARDRRIDELSSNDCCKGGR